MVLPCPYEQIYIQDISHSKAELKLPSISGLPIIDPHLSPDGSMLAYIHGLAEYIAQEEMDRKTGYWWSLDSNILLLLKLILLKYHFLELCTKELQMLKCALGLFRLLEARSLGWIFSVGAWNIKTMKMNIWQETGQRKTILVEENSTWINIHDCFTPLDKGITKFSGGFIWASEKTGFRHLYLHDANGTCLGPITEGEWMVEQIAGVNEAT
ncbi:Dipeptidylpeptidase IV, N-terminal domain, partial [Sesbania bispinosa]